MHEDPMVSVTQKIEVKKWKHDEVKTGGVVQEQSSHAPDNLVTMINA